MHLSSAAMSESVQPATARPLVALTTDFGNRDFYVAAMKAVLLRALPDVRLIDVTHEVPRHDIIRGSIVLERAIASFMPGVFHLAVIDPGVGTGRKIMVAGINRQTIICPDNGLITWAWRCLTPEWCSELKWRPPSNSSVFHGRDIMAPALAMLASGRPLSELTTPLSNPILLDIAPAPRDATVGQIIYIDHFGNATTNFGADLLRAAPGAVVHAAGRNLGKLRQTYGDAAVGEPLALIGSSELLEIAVCEGSAAERLGLRVGERVMITMPRPGAREP